MDVRDKSKCFGKFQNTACWVISKLYLFTVFQNEMNSFIVMQPGGQRDQTVATESYNLQTDKTATAAQNKKHAMHFAHTVHMNTDFR